MKSLVIDVSFFLIVKINRDYFFDLSCITFSTAMLCVVIGGASTFPFSKKLPDELENSSSRVIFHVLVLLLNARVGNCIWVSGLSRLYGPQETVCHLWRDIRFVKKKMKKKKNDNVIQWCVNRTADLMICYNWSCWWRMLKMVSFVSSVHIWPGRENFP